MAIVIQQATHTLNPLLIIAIIFGIVILFFTILILGKKFHWWSKLRSTFIYQFEGSRGKALHILMLQKNKQLTDMLVLHDDTNTFEYNKGKYTINSKFFIYKFDKAYSLYIEGNPNPLEVDFDTKKIKMDTETFKEVLNQKLIRDLFVEGKETILLVIILILTALNILLQIAIKTGMLDKIIKK